MANFTASRVRRRRVDAFISVSSAVAASTDLPGRCRYEVIPNFVPDDLVVNEVVPRPDGPIVYVGDLSRDKGIEVLIDAFRRLHRPTRLLLAGRVLAETPPELPERVELLGMTDHDRDHGVDANGAGGRRSVHRSRLLPHRGPGGDGRRKAGRGLRHRRDRGPRRRRGHRHPRRSG